MNRPKILITAATGATGGEAISALLEDGQEVRALVHRDDERADALRRRGAEVVIGDLNDYASIKAALRGMGRAYFCYPIAPGLIRATAQFAQAAKEAGLDAIVNMSQIVAREEAVSHASFDHWLAERVLDGAGVPVTHLRPTFFAEWLLYVAPMVRQGKVFMAYGPGKTALIAAEDQGRVIARVLQDPRPHAGRTYPLRGPVEQTWPEIAATVGRVLGKPVEYQRVPFEAMRDAMLGDRADRPARNDASTGYAESNRPGESGESHISQHLREATLDHHAGLFGGTDDIVERLTGRKPLSVEEFVTKHRTAFE